MKILYKFDLAKLMIREKENVNKMTNLIVLI
jgi:hypothetical protein